MDAHQKYDFNDWKMFHLWSFKLEEKKPYEKVMWAYLKDVVPYLETDF